MLEINEMPDGIPTLQGSEVMSSGIIPAALHDNPRVIQVGR